MFEKRKRCRRGFTLIEASLTTMIVGVGLLATLQLLAAGTSTNVDGANLTAGMNLARNVRELSLKSTFAEVRAMHNRTHSPPIDSCGTPMPGFGDWSQIIQVQAVDRDRLALSIVDPFPDVVRVTVSVALNGNKVCELSWYRFKPMP